MTRYRSDNIFLLTLPYYTPRNDRERVCQILFEKLDVPGMYIADPAHVALFACNTTSGLVLDIGYSTSEATPLIESSIYAYSRQSVHLGSSDVEKHLIELLKKDEKFMKEYGQQPDQYLARAILSSSSMYVQANPSVPLSDERISFTYKEKQVNFYPSFF